MHIFARQAVASEARPVPEVPLKLFSARCLQLILQPQQQQDECKDGSTYSALHRYGWGSLPGHNCLFATVPPLPLHRDVAVVRDFVTAYCFVRCSDTKAAEPGQAKRNKAKSEFICPGPHHMNIQANARS